MSYIELSEKAKAVCKKYYPGPCDICPINAQCIDRGGRHDSKDTLNAYTDRINKASEVVTI